MNAQHVLRDPRLSRLAAVGVLFIALAMAWGLVVQPYDALLARQQADYEQRVERLAALRRIAAEIPALKAALEKGAPILDGQDSYLPGDNDALAAAALQSRLGRLANEAGVAVNRVEPANRGGDASDRVALTLIANGPIDGLRNLLHAVESSRPLLSVEELDLQSASTAQPQFSPAGHVLLTIRLRVAGYRRTP